MKHSSTIKLNKGVREGVGDDNKKYACDGCKRIFDSEKEALDHTTACPEAIKIIEDAKKASSNFILSAVIGILLGLGMVFILWVLYTSEIDKDYQAILTIIIIITIGVIFIGVFIFIFLRFNMGGKVSVYGAFSRNSYQDRVDGENEASRWACGGCKEKFNSEEKALDHAITCPDAISTKPIRFDKFIASTLYNWRNFSGRSSRTEYWCFALFAFTIYWLTGKLDDLFFSEIIEVWSGIDQSYVSITIEKPHHGMFSFFGFVLLFFPSFALSVRRLHDIGYSAWVLVVPILAGAWVMLVPVIGMEYVSWMGVVPIIGILFEILPLAFAFVPSEDKTNRYGKVPTNNITKILIWQSTGKGQDKPDEEA